MKLIRREDQTVELSKIKIRKILIMCLVIFVIVLIIVFLLATYAIAEILDKDKLESVYYIMQTVAILLLACSAIIAMSQYRIYCKSEETRFTTEYVQKAIDTAAFFKDNIVTKYRAVKYVYKETDIKKILQKMKIPDMIKFDKRELDFILSDENQKKLKQIQKSPKFVNKIIDANTIYGFDHNIYNQNKSNLKKQDKEVVVAIFSDLINELLNDLEFFAMHYIHETADKETVFFPLHATYLEIVQVLYYSIAKVNVCPINKLYQNVVELYRIWYQQEEKMHNCISEKCADECRGPIVDRSHNRKSKK